MLVCSLPVLVTMYSPLQSGCSLAQSLREASVTLHLLLRRRPRVHVPLVGGRLPVQPPPLLRPRRRGRHAPRPLPLPQGDFEFPAARAAFEAFVPLPESEHFRRSS